MTALATASDTWRTRLAAADVGAVMRRGVPAPTLHAGLLYPGALHSLTGESDAGKTMLAAKLAAVTLDTYTPVVWLDEETGIDGVAERLLALKVDPADVDRGLHYFEFPGLNWTADIIAVRDMLDETRPGLVVIDSSAATLVSAGLEENSNHDVGRLYKHLLKAARRSTAAFVILDHYGRADTGGKYARGASSKRNLVDVGYHLEPVRPFSRTQSGALRLTVTKDRFGWLTRQHEVAVTVDDSGIDITIRADNTPPAATLSPAATKILEALTQATQPLSNAQIVDAIAATHGHGLRRETVSRELNQLARNGHVDSLDDVDGKRWLRPHQEV